MNEAFVIRNQLGHYWGKKKCWVDGRRAKIVMLCKHEDEGLNLLVELSSRDIDLRGEVVAVATSEKGVALVTPSEYLLPDQEDLLSPPSPEEQSPEEQQLPE
jgi:hypothetical protein